MIHTHERILRNICDNYTVLGDIFFIFSTSFMKHDLWKVKNFVVKLLLSGCALKNIRTNEQACITNCDK